MATGSSSTASSSTVGISFDVDPLGKYSFQVSSLTKKTFQERVDSLIDHIEKTITALERYSSRAVEKFTIGKTFAPARAHNTFDPENEDTWRVDGITKRWHGHYKGIGYDGLVVVGAVSRKMLTDTSYRDRKCNTGVWDQQSYALALESALICHYAFKTFDPRLANESFYPGKKKQIEEDKEEDKAAAGGIVYFAFKYEQKGENPVSVDNDSEESTVGWNPTPLYAAQIKPLHRHTSPSSTESYVKTGKERGNVDPRNEKMEKILIMRKLAMQR